MQESYKDSRHFLTNATSKTFKIMQGDGKILYRNLIKYFLSILNNQVESTPPCTLCKGPQLVFQFVRHDGKLIEVLSH